ncbi:MAG: UDP-N-acetylmuramate dehydrogenase [Ginsengibacter sp.]
MQILKNHPLKNYNTFGIDSYAKYFAAFSSVYELQNLLQSKEHNDEPKLILGAGSNILLTKNFEGFVLKNEISGIQTIHEEEKHVYVKVGGGVNWHNFVLHCIHKNFAGVENLSLIPGNVGASPMQNIGAYGVEIRDVFYSLEAYSYRENRIINFTLNDCEFGYRESVFKKRYKNQFAILDVTFKLNKIPHYNISYGAIEEELKKMHVHELSIKAISDAVINIRMSKLPNPKMIGNAGSFFKNPEINSNKLHELRRIGDGIPSYKIDDDKYKIPAGWLIEQCGWKGYRKGDVGCYEKQALVLVNYGNANGNEILTLSEEIKKSIQNKFGILLETEVNTI